MKVVARDIIYYLVLFLLVMIYYLFFALPILKK